MINEEIKDEENGHLWRSCCGVVSDRRLLVFSSNLSISLIILLFSFYKLNQDLDCSHENLYVGFISLILGYWIKSPIH